MFKVCVIYGSTTGNSADAAEKIASQFENAELINASEANAPINCDLLILGASTWGVGDLQDDMIDFIDKFEQPEINAEFGAVFGLGNQIGYPDSFVDGIADMAAFLEKKGIKQVGLWNCEGYDFAESRARLPDGRFMGLALDEDNQPELTEKRISQWVKQIKSECKA